MTLPQLASLCQVLDLTYLDVAAAVSPARRFMLAARMQADAGAARLLMSQFVDASLDAALPRYLATVRAT